MPSIASKKEWGIAKEILAKKKMEKELPSGFKILKKDHKELKHSFIYFKNDTEEKLFCPSVHYYLGQGGEGKVKLAEDENGNLYALKRMSNDDLYHESKILKHLGRLIFEGGNGHWYYDIQPFHEGLTLNEYVYSCSLTKEQKLAVIYHVANALQALHQENIVHGDIKVNNFLISVTDTNKPTVTPIDFNLSRLLSAEKMPKYIPNEIKRFISLAKELGVDDFEQIMDTKLSLEEIISTLEKYKEIPLPLPDTKKRLIEEYVHEISAVMKRIQEGRTDEESGREHMIDFISYNVKRTNDITELNEFFRAIKDYESQNPFLQKKQNNWKNVVTIFQKRALQIVNDNINLEIPIANPAAHYHIFADNNGKRSLFKNDNINLRQFEHIFKKNNAVSNDEKEHYRRAKLIKFLDNYIYRIQGYRDTKSGKEINYRHGFWFAKNKQAVNREVNFKSAISLREKLADLNNSLADIFNENNIQEMRNSYDIKPNRKKIGSSELMDIIHLGEKIAKQESPKSPTM